MKPSVCHGPAISKCQSVRAIAPCRAVIRMATSKHPGDSMSNGTRFINCKKCLRLGKRGKFRLIENRHEQLALRLS